MYKKYVKTISKSVKSCSEILMVLYDLYHSTIPTFGLFQH